MSKSKMDGMLIRWQISTRAYPHMRIVAGIRLSTLIRTGELLWQQVL